VVTAADLRLRGHGSNREHRCVDRGTHFAPLE